MIPEHLDAYARECVLVDGGEIAVRALTLLASMLVQDVGLRRYLWNELMMGDGINLGALSDGNDWGRDATIVERFEAWVAWVVADGPKPGAWLDGSALEAGVMP